MLGIGAEDAVVRVTAIGAVKAAPAAASAKSEVEPAAASRPTSAPATRAEPRLTRLEAQMPILFALYQALYVLAGSGHLKNAPFFFIPDLSLPGSTAATAGVIDGIPMIGTTWISTAFKEQNWYVLFAYMSLPIFMLFTQMLLQKMSMPAKDPKTGKADAQTQMMGQMMFLMPVMFFWITLGLPAGLTLYWSVSNVLGMVQQYFVTGWGSLPDWFKFLKKPQPATVAITASSMPAQTAMPVTTDPVEKPMKRRKRRK